MVAIVFIVSIGGMTVKGRRDTARQQEQIEDLTRRIHSACSGARGQLTITRMHLASGNAAGPVLALRDSTMTKLCGGEAATIWDEAMRREPDPDVLRKAIDDLDAAWAHW